MSKAIELGKGQIATVDDADYEWLSQWSWNPMPNSLKTGFYAVRCVWRPEGKPQVETIYMHRLIVGLGYGDRRRCDHRDGNTLNNTRSNLRIATHQQNCVNSKLYKTNKTGFKGVMRKGNKFVAAMHRNGKGIHIGTYGTPEEAHAAWCEVAKQFHGEFFRAS